MKKRKTSGWGLFPSKLCKMFEPKTVNEIQTHLAALTTTCIPRGNGRSYGDSALNTANIILMLGLNKFLSFDEHTGVLECESGVLLADVFDILLPKGWISPVTPGTKFVTIGGMIASDVHGKNHHVLGNFCSYVLSIRILTANNEIIECSREQNANLFFATCGGMGLTGIILRATIKMMKVETAYIKRTTIPTKNLKQTIEVFNKTADSTYSVAWIDCLAKGNNLGRSVVVLGEHAKLDELPCPPENPCQLPSRQRLSVPFFFPSFVLNRLSVSAFNSLYYFANKRKPRNSILDLDSFFYPLDTVSNWNKIYGRRGFVQYQCVIPVAQSKKGITKVLETISRSGQGSFLAVLKMFGNSVGGLFSFPIEGLTLALDFKVNKKTLELCEELDRIVAMHGGHLYLTKDARQSSEMFQKSHPGISAFKDFRKKAKADKLFSSLQSERLQI